MKTIISHTRRVSKNVSEGFVGTTLDYGLILETQMGRSFLVRTLNENKALIRKVLTGPIK